MRNQRLIKTYQRSFFVDWIYGIHAIQTMLKSAPQRVAEIHVQSGRRDDRLQKIYNLAEQHGILLQPVTSKKLDAKVQGRHQGVIALCRPGETRDESFLVDLAERHGAQSFFLMLDGVTDPHNLGACLRSADAAGVHAVIVPKDNSVGLTPVVQKVACGAAESVPLVTVTNLTRTLDKLQQLGIWAVGTTGEAKESLYKMDLTGAIVVVMGAEGDGMRHLTSKQCDFLAKLPMAGEVESLNVSVATGVCLFEIVRQRSIVD
ncbi:MAG: 23S rRNA (guanosine2251-2'-O)-methyltransferase [Polaribacter sp.]|jgi:23S rRNA (guanosine2251-2'-O)-methyltransferase|tara:strand:- start:7119 stop:7901 length:783 start_codon:yes stop_codon:yes gene_type:complete